MKQKIIFIFIITLLASGVWANGVAHTRGEITELYFEEMGFWTIEIEFTHINSYYDSVLCIHSSTDSAFLNFMPEQTGIYLINYTDLTSGLSIDKTGDSLYIMTYWYGGYPTNVSYKSFVFGDFTSSRVNAPESGQSLVGLPELINSSNYWRPMVVKDTIPSLGYIKDPVRGTIKGNVYDSTGTPMPFQLLHIEGILDRTICTDENGYFKVYMKKK